ncbi:putative ribonuclease H-like domain-containing protein [Tanacetum coccineum]
MVGGHDFHETEEVLQEDKEKAVGILLESEDQKGIKSTGGEMQGILGSDTEREQLGDASIEIQAYTQALKKMIKTDVLTYHKKLLAEAVKEKEELNTKLKAFQNYSKGLNILLNSQMSVKDKVGLGYGNQMHEGILSYENEVFQSVFDTRFSDIEDSPVNDRYAEGMHAVLPPMIGIFISSGPNFEIDDSLYTYGQKQSKTSESDARTSDYASCESNVSVETLESVPKTVVTDTKAVSKPKVWSDAPIIKEYESDSDDEHVTIPSKEQEQPSFAFVNTVKHVKTPRQTVKEQNTCSQSPKPNKRDWNGLMSKRLGLGYGFIKKACFVCGSFNHLIRDCDFHEKIMAKQVELNKQKVQTRTGKFLIHAARQNFSTQAASTSTARNVNTARPMVNENKLGNNFYKSHLPIRRPFNITTTPKVNIVRDKIVSAVGVNKDDPQKALKNKGSVDSGCSRHMTRNKAYLVEYQDYNGGPVAFRGSKGHITGKGKIRTRKLDFEDVCFVKELQQFNLFSVLQMYDKKNKVLFTDTKCLVLSPDFKLHDENQVLLKVPRQNNMYSFNLENIVPTRGLAYLIAKAIVDESNKWHRRLGHANFKNLNKLVKGNLVRGLPSKIFQNDHTCVVCQKGKQHKASCKAKVVSSISQPLQLFHMDLFGPTSVRSINHKTYCLVITDDFSRIKREYSNARTPQQNRVAKRKNMTLIEVARTMLADSFLPNTFRTKAVSIACYVLNRVLVTKPQNKTPYELITGKIPIISYIRPFGCHVTILNTIDHLGKFDEKSHEGFLVGYSLNIKAFRVYNLESKRVEENLHIKFLENKPNVAGKGPIWLFDLDYLTDSMNYQPVRSKNQANKTAGPKEANNRAGTQANIDTEEVEHAQEYCVLPSWSSYTSTVKSSESKNEGKKPKKDTGTKSNEKPVDQEEQAFLEELERLKRQEKEADDAAEALRKEFAQGTEDLLLQSRAAKASSTNSLNTVSIPISTASPSRVFSTDNGIFTNASYDDEGAVADFINLEKIVNVSPIPTSRIHSIHPITQILGDLTSAVQTISKVNKIEPKKTSEVLEDESWVNAMKEELLQFKIQKMDVKSAFLYGTIDEENGYRRGSIDKTLFIKKDKKDIILVQVYVDDIIFGSTKKSWCDEFEVLMKSRFQMSSMGELTFFLGLQVKQKEDGILISQDKYVAEILKKFDFVCVKTASTPIETQKPLTKDEEATNVDVHLYRSMIGSLMYLTTSRPDIMFAVCACSRFQVTLKTSHLHAMKRIFRYLKGKSKVGLWYPRVSSFDLEAYLDSNYAGANLDRKSIIGGCQFLGRRLILWQYKKQTIVATSTTEAEYVAAANCCD